MDRIRPSLAFRLWRRIVFAFGDWMTQYRDPRVQASEYEKIIPDLQPGDVVLHRDDRFGPANWFIGGLMIHAGIYIGNGEIVEAISEGVVRRDVGKILESDYTMVVRPNNVFSQYARAHVIQDACIKARTIEGFGYDTCFDFCDAVEFDALQKIKFNYVPAKWAEIGKAAGIEFCCTEIPYFCYYPVREILGLWRRRNVSVLTKALGWIGIPTGEAVIDADIYVTAPGFDLIWCSSTVTVGWVNRMHARGYASESLMSRVVDYWQAKWRSR